MSVNVNFSKIKIILNLNLKKKLYMVNTRFKSD